jgi:hypothetical protein
MNPPSVCATLLAIAVALILVFGHFSISMLLVSSGAAAIVYSITSSLQYATGSAIVALFTMAGLMRYGVIKKEGFNVFTGPGDISKMVRKLKEGFTDDDEEKKEEGFTDDDEEKKEEGFTDDDEEKKEEGFTDDDEEKKEEGFSNEGYDMMKGLGSMKPLMSLDEGFRSMNHRKHYKKRRKGMRRGSRRRASRKMEGFMNQVYQNITKSGYNSPGFGMAGPLVEGFEDEKKAEKKGKPAPTIKKEEMAMPFKLGEIPSQVKNGPHIDAGSTLIKAIQGLNPEQINAMTKDTKQLIETQKSLMGMLGTMKPMMNDGKELMETFQQMFGENAK